MKKETYINCYNKINFVHKLNWSKYFETFDI